MKKIHSMLCILLTVIFMISMAACSKKETISDTSTDASEESSDSSSTSESDSPISLSSDSSDSSNTGTSSNAISSTVSNGSVTSKDGGVFGTRTTSNTKTTYPAVIDMQGATLVLGTKWEGEFGNSEPGESAKGDKWIAWRQNFEKTFNCHLENSVVSSYTLYDTIATKLMSGEKVADVITMQLYDVEAFRHAGLLQPLQSLPSLNLEHPKVIQSMVNNFTFNGNSYLYFYGNNVYEVDGFYFNRDMIKELNLTNPYQLVKEKKWTWSAFSSMCAAAYKDLNSNNTIDIADRFGAYFSYDSVEGSLRSSGVKIISYNNGSFNYTFNTPTCLNYLTQIKDSVNKGNLFINPTEMTAPRAASKFVNGQLLFCREDSKIMSDEEHVFWGIDFDYGYLPVPTFEEGQSYYNTCSTWLGGLCVPKNTNQNMYIGYLMNSIADMTASLSEEDKADQLRYFGNDQETYDIYKSYDSVFQQELYCWQTQFKDLFTLTFNSMVFDPNITAASYIDSIDNSMKNAVGDYYSKDPDLIE